MKSKARQQAAIRDFLRFEVKSIDADTGVFIGYAAVWGNVDQANDVCEPGCCHDTLATWAARGTLPRVFWAHWHRIGHATKLVADDTGLYVEGRLWVDRPDVATIHRELLDAMPNVGMSFGYVAEDYEKRDGKRYITRLTLGDDITITLRPVNDQAAVTEIKDRGAKGVAAYPSARTTEAILRDAGFSRRDARVVIAGGHAALREAKSGDGNAAALVGQLATILAGLEKANAGRP